MLYFKHSDLVNDYHVSLKTVHNWIDAAKQGKLDLQLHELNGRIYVANTQANTIALEKLADKGKKYRNTLHQKVVTPKPEFYELYNRRQILDIISNLKIHHEIPRQYNYFDGGAENWNKYTLRLLHEDQNNVLKNTISIVKSNLDAVDRFMEGSEKINLIDIGPGNALPVKDVLAHLLEKDMLHRYIAIDISESMLEIARRNIQKWFGDKVKFEGYVRDIRYERFDDLLVDDLLNVEKRNIANLVLMLGGTVANFRDPVDVLKVVYGSMDNDDLFMYTRKPDTKLSRHYFDFSHQEGSSGKLSPNHRFILDLMNIDDSLYEVEAGFDTQEHQRFIRVKLKSALTIKFKFDNGAHREVSFEKGDTILMLRVWHQTLMEVALQFEEVGFVLLHSSFTKDRECLLTVLGVDKGLATSI